MKLVDQDGNDVNPTTDRVYILSIPYSYDPEASFSRSVRIVKWFRDQGLIIFSPIMHTHPYHIKCLEENPNHTDDYYDWDISLYTVMKSNATIVLTKDYDISKGCKIEMDWAIAESVPMLYIEEFD